MDNLNSKNEVDKIVELRLIRRRLEDITILLTCMRGILVGELIGLAVGLILAIVSSKKFSKDETYASANQTTYKCYNPTENTHFPFKLPLVFGYL